MLGIVFELLVVEEELLAGSEYISAPQSMHIKTLSVNSMAGFPKEGK